MDIICVVDVSGSMGAEATLQDDKGNTESHGLCVLDVVKHAVGTIATFLQRHDRLGVVAYNESAWTVLDLTAMDDAGKRKAKRVTGALQQRGRTNVWGGLLQAIEMADAGRKDDGRQTSVLLLTDGRPNVEPPRGTLATLKRHVRTSGLPCTINTFGFGYDMDSPLLKNLAAEGHGTYAFIPDASFVGTVFINATSNILATACPALVVKVEGAGAALTVDHDRWAEVQAHRNEVEGEGEGMQAAGTTVVFHIGALLHGQSRHIVLPVAADASGRDLRITVSRGVGLPGVVYFDGDVTVDAAGGAGGGAMEVDVQRNRLRTVVALDEALDICQLNPDRARAAVVHTAESLQGSRSARERRVKALLEDVKGQVALSFDATHHGKWGKHFLPSILRTHALQQCNNFKDPGCQVYGGDLSEALRDEADDIFNSLPPPVASVVARAPHGGAPRGGGGAGRSLGGGGGGGGHTRNLGGARKQLATKAARKSAPAAAAQPVNMAVYNNRHGGCFDGDCLVEMADGSLRAAAEVKRGDVVATFAASAGEGRTGEQAGQATGQSVVRCVVQTNCPDGRQEMVELAELSDKAGNAGSAGKAGPTRLTPWHPVRVDTRAEEGGEEAGNGERRVSEWQFPAQIGDVRIFDTPAVYDFVLAQGHVVSVGGRPCVTFGHGLTGPVVAHDYFGTDRVVDDLEGMAGWDDGLVELTAGRCFLLDPESGRVSGLQQ